MIPRSLRHECGNCRHRHSNRTADGETLYHVCHQGPPVMLAQPDNALRTWYPIVSDIMFCSYFSYPFFKRLALIAGTVAIVAATAGAAYWLMRG